MLCIEFMRLDDLLSRLSMSEFGGGGKAARVAGQEPVRMHVHLHSLDPVPPGVTNDPWGDMMAAAQNGNGGAYRRLLEEVDVWLRRYFARRLPPPMVEDAAQDTLLALHARRHTYEPSRTAWLSGIARYKGIDSLRARARDHGGAGDEDLLALPGFGDHGIRVTDALLVEQLIGRLKPSQARVIALVKLGGLSIEEASEQTGQSVSLVKVNIHRGLTTLKTFILSEAA
jgi:RNA polymerase sigma factor (sigma-70 family)